MNKTIQLSEHFRPMTREEMHDTNGGILLVILAGLTIAAGAQIMGDWDNFKNGLCGRHEQ